MSAGVAVGAMGKVVRSVSGTGCFVRTGRLGRLLGRDVFGVAMGAAVAAAVPFAVVFVVALAARASHSQ